jgi:hypothetical protein
MLESFKEAFKATGGVTPVILVNKGDPLLWTAATLF